MEAEKARADDARTDLAVAQADGTTLAIEAKRLREDLQIAQEATQALQERLEERAAGEGAAGTARGCAARGVGHGRSNALLIERPACHPVPESGGPTLPNPYGLLGAAADLSLKSYEATSRPSCEGAPPAPSGPPEAA
jgi:hypothetical protein